MDPETRKFYEEQERLGGRPHLAEALEAERLGLPLPFHELHLLTQGHNLSLSVSGPSLRVSVQVAELPNMKELEKIREKVSALATENFGLVVFGLHERVFRVYDPHAWGQYLPN